MCQSFPPLKYTVYKVGARTSNAALTERSPQCVYARTFLCGSNLSVGDITVYLKAGLRKRWQAELNGTHSDVEFAHWISARKENRFGDTTHYEGRPDSIMPFTLLGA